MKKIYTKTGDKGQTSLYGGKRVAKNDLRIETYGAIDELNSVLGLIISEIQNSKVKSQNYKAKVKSDEILIKIQKDLLLIGSLLAGYKNSIKNLKLKIKNLEDWIDNLEKELPELRNFILPGGSGTASLLHLGRSVCRRAERRLVELAQKEKVQPEILSYLNRLSDLLFEMARLVNFKQKKKEIIWKI